MMRFLSFLHVKSRTDDSLDRAEARQNVKIKSDEKNIQQKDPICVVVD